MRPKPKKSLGQNFLTDPNIRRKIVQVCCFDAEDSILEIGPGYGEITEIIAARVKKLVAVEIDRVLYEKLKERLGRLPNIIILKADILKADPKRLFPEEKGKIKVFGNIPYYISSPIIEYLISNRGMFSDIFLTVQKEFGRRIAAKPGTKDYGSFSCFVQYFTRPSIIFEIKRGCFYPAPKVDSVLLRLLPREHPAVKVDDEEHFFNIIRHAFGQRRKTLRNSLKDIVSSDTLDRFFQTQDIDFNIRPECLSLHHFAALSNLAAGGRRTGQFPQKVRYLPII